MSVRFEMLRTFPVSRTKGYALMRDLSRWSMWSPVEVDVDEMSFTFTPLGVGFSGDLSVVDEVEHETCGFVFSAPGFPEVDMRWWFSHAGPGAFTLRLTVATDPKDWWQQVVEKGAFMVPTLRRSLRRALDDLELMFLGELPAEPKEIEEKVAVS
ncbi:MAG: hypothetical protein R6X29_08850 [Acidimicrobiia bacterium]|jgi:hypothetical protein